MRDLTSNIAAVPAILPEVLSGNRTGPAIDLRGFNRAAFVIATGAIDGGGSFAVKIQHSDTASGGDFEDAEALWITGDAPSPLGADSAYRLGYHGHKRFVRLVVSKSGGNSVAIAATAMLADPAEAPVA
jgi:hypothetical protein